MTEELTDQLREKDRAVLRCIQEGHDDTRAIREETTLSNRDVNYALDKLEDLGLIETRAPEGRVTALVDGQERNFKAPREANLTEKGQKSQWEDQSTKYIETSDRQLVEKVQELEHQVSELENKFNTFRRQVLDRFN